MWHIARYHPVTLFSLRPANATTSGGKTLLCPTPFAIKMALLNAAITLYGQGSAEAWFEERLCSLPVAVRLPDALLVIATFQRILRPKRGDNFGTGLVGSWQSNIAFREYVHFGGVLEIAVRVADGDDDAVWAYLFSQISYLGKRGSFLQFAEHYTCAADDDLPPEGFTWLNPPATGDVMLDGILQLMDDCGPEMTFAHANIYDPGYKNLRINTPQGRLLKTIVLPYRIVRSARGFTSYRHVGLV